MPRVSMAAVRVRAPLASAPIRGRLAGGLRRIVAPTPSPRAPARPSSLVLLFTVALAIAVGGCSRSYHADEAAAAPLAAETSNDAPGSLPTPADGAGSLPADGTGAAAQAGASAQATRALVVTIKTVVVTDDPDAVAARARAEVERAGGFVASATTRGSGADRSVELELKVPHAETRPLRVLLSDLGRIASDEEKSEDVTEQRADLNARLRNAQAQEKRTLELLAQRTGSLQDVLEAERELARIRETVERLDAQKRSLDGKVDLATVRLSVLKTASEWQPPPEPTALSRVLDAGGAGVKAAGTLLLFLAMAFAASAPILVPALLLASAIVYLVRRHRRQLAEARAQRLAEG